MPVDISSLAAEIVKTGYIEDSSQSDPHYFSYFAMVVVMKYHDKSNRRISLS